MQIWDRICVWLDNHENLLLIALILLYLIPIWVFKYFPSQDGPTHVENANIIFNYFRPDRGIFREYYILNRSLEPTWLGHLVLGSLMSILPIFTAEKVFLTGCVILLPVSIRYALRAIRPDSGFLTLLMFPFVYSYLLHMGFYTFSYSLSVFFFSVGYWIRYSEQFTLPKAVNLGFLLLLLYFCHILSLVMACVGITILTLWLISVDLTRGKLGGKFDFQVLRATLRKRGMPLLGFLPAIVLVVIFLFQRGFGYSEVLPPSGIRKSLGELFINLIQIESLVSFQREEFFCSAGLAVLFAAVFSYLAAWKIRQRRLEHWDGLLAVVLGYVLIYLFAPNEMSGGSFIPDRLNLYPFFALVLWFGIQFYRRTVKWRIMLIAIFIALASLGLHALKYSELNDYLTEYYSGMQFIRPNTTLLPLAFSSRGRGPDGRVLSLKVRPFLHASGYIAAQRHVVEFTNYEAAAFNYFPVMFRPNLNPYVHIGRDQKIVWEPPQVDFLTYAERTGGQVDYVLVWGAQEHERNHEPGKSIYQQIKKGYDLIYTSPRTGWMQLYERKN